VPTAESEDKGGEGGGRHGESGSFQPCDDDGTAYDCCCCCCLVGWQCRKDPTRAVQPYLGGYDRHGGHVGGDAVAQSALAPSGVCSTLATKRLLKAAKPQTANPKPRHAYISARVMAAVAGRWAQLPGPHTEGDAASTWNVPTATPPPTTTPNDLCSNRARRRSRSVRVAHRPLSASLRRNTPHVVRACWTAYYPRFLSVPVKCQHSTRACQRTGVGALHKRLPGRRASLHRADALPRGGARNAHDTSPGPSRHTTDCRALCLVRGVDIPSPTQLHSMHKTSAQAPAQSSTRRNTFQYSPWQTTHSSLRSPRQRDTEMLRRRPRSRSPPLTPLPCSAYPAPLHGRVSHSFSTDDKGRQTSLLLLLLPLPLGPDQACHVAGAVGAMGESSACDKAGARGGQSGRGQWRRGCTLHIAHCT
jgi:hypothetical protein